LAPSPTVTVFQDREGSPAISDTGRGSASVSLL